MHHAQNTIIMKQLKAFFILLLMSIPAIGMAQTVSQPSTPKPPITLQKKTTGYLKTPKVPSRQVITCAFDGNGLEFHFAISEGMSTLTVSDAQSIPKTFTIDSSKLDAYVHTGSLYGSIIVMLYTELDNHYEGIFE